MGLSQHQQIKKNKKEKEKRKRTNHQDEYKKKSHFFLNISASLYKK